ncbi:MAG: hypothetical protein A2033_11090 [Bacteroidetes bacterium GWA2_31_9]|nr:MAG: hypothetical protein A2033_11090 [Bacteroidetes bacterium GWA2_31_9]
MRICYFGDGESVHIVRFCSHFKQLGHDVHLISFKNVKIEGITNHYINTGNITVSGGNWKVLLQAGKVKKLLKQIKPDIFHSIYATSYGITGALCGFHPYFITTLGSDVLISPQNSKLYKLLLKYAFSKADWIQTLAPHMSDAVLKIGSDINKVSVIPFGIDINIFNDKCRQENTDNFIITSTRNHEEIYNIPLLINALGKIKNKIPNLKFMFTGSGSLTEKFKELIVENGLKELTTFTGRITQAEMVKLLNETSLFVSVSFSDGNNLSLAEAMSCGCFCIGSDIPANKLWIDDNTNGFLVNTTDVNNLAEKILYANTNYNELQQLAKNINKSKIKNTGIWDNNMKKVEEKYFTFIN